MTDILIDGLRFGEGPRWHDGRLWLSDMHDRKVLAVDETGGVETIVTLADDEPSGLGWLPDGRLLIVSMRKRQLLCFNGGVLSVFADISDLASYHCNDMVTDKQGRSYIGNFGFDLHTGASASPAEIVMVGPDGSASIVADELSFPNGTVITPDGKTLIVGESVAGRLTAFDVADDGSLHNRRLWAAMEGAIPDGICLDDAGGIWVASPTSREALRILEGGEVTDRIKVKHQAYACMLGGSDGRTLFILTSAHSNPDKCALERTAAVETARVSHAGAGLP